jgi:hypothetical protein
MKKIFYYPLLLTLVLMAIGLQSAYGKAYVKSSNGKWYTFNTLCCCHFIINSSNGEMCVDNNDCSNCPDGQRTADPGVSLEALNSHLTRVTDYLLTVSGDGCYNIMVGGVPLFTLTAEGKTLFDKSGGEFYNCNIEKVNISSGKITVADATKTGNVNAVSLGKLTPEQEANIIRLGDAIAPEPFMLVVSNVPKTKKYQIDYTAQAPQTANLQIIAFNGTPVHSSDQKSVAGENKTTLDLSANNPGTYYVLLSLDGKVWKREFMIE